MSLFYMGLETIMAAGREPVPDPFLLLKSPELAALPRMLRRE